MMQKLPLAAILLGALVGPTRADAPRIAFEKYALKNGLEVILSADHRVPVVHIEVWYHVGSKDEKPGKTGFAHLFEHMMFQGSRNIAEDTWFKRLDAVGGSAINGTTNTDRTDYFESVPSHQLELALWMESDRMGYLLDHVTEDSFKNQQDVVRNERRQRMEMAPYGMASKFRLEALYPPAHPYHHTVIGEHEDLVRASVGDVKAFFRRYYVPANATLAIVGDFDPAQTKEWIQKYFGSLPAAPPPTRKPAGPPAAPVQRLLPMEANVELPRLEYVWHGPVAWSAEEPALDLLADVLTDGKTSRLHKRLVYELRIAQNVSAFSNNNDYGGQFMITVMVKPGHTVDEIRKVVDEELARIGRQPVAAAELARVKTKWEAHFIRGLETNAGRASQLQSANHYTRNPDKANQDLARHLQVTPEAILGAAQKWLRPENKLVLTVVPSKEAPISGQVVVKTQEKK